MDRIEESSEETSFRYFDNTHSKRLLHRLSFIFNEFLIVVIIS